MRAGLTFIDINLSVYKRADSLSWRRSSSPEQRGSVRFGAGCDVMRPMALCQVCWFRQHPNYLNTQQYHGTVARNSSLPLKTVTLHLQCLGKLFKNCFLQLKQREERRGLTNKQWNHQIKRQKGNNAVTVQVHTGTSTCMYTDVHSVRTSLDVDYVCIMYTCTHVLHYFYFYTVL